VNLAFKAAVELNRTFEVDDAFEPHVLTRNCKMLPLGLIFPPFPRISPDDRPRCTWIHNMQAREFG
jgi:hypothetical protein